MRVYIIGFMLLIFSSSYSFAATTQYQTDVVFHGKYNKYYFVAYNTANGQPYSRWEGAQFKKFGSAIVSGSEEGTFAFNAFYSAKFKMVRHCAINTKTGQIYSRWESKPWKMIGKAVDSRGSTKGRFSLSSIFNSKHKLFYYFSVDSKSGQAYTQWGNRGWKKQAAPIAR